MNCNVNKEDSNVCHWSTDKENVIIKFYQRKDCGKILKAKIDIRKVNTSHLNLRVGSKVFVNQSLSSYYCLLWSKSKKLLWKCKIFGWYVSKESVKIKIQEDIQPIYFPIWRISKGNFLMQISTVCKKISLHGF